MIERARRASRRAWGRAAQAVGHQGDVGVLQRDVGAGGAHGDANARRGQRGRVVDAVADHRDDGPVALQVLDGA
jgi:hypothetical protein